MRRNWRSNRGLLLIASLFLCSGLILGSQAGFLAPLETIIAAPLNLLSGIFTRVAIAFSSDISDLSELQSLRQRNAELEEALAVLLAELPELREIASDYQRLSELLNYTRSTQDQEYVVAEVIGIDTSGFLRTVTINRGTRDGISPGMPVVTAQGLVGRILDASANAARVLLITDQNSVVSARLQATRAQGSVEGQPGGSLRMTFIPIGSEIRENDLVITSGLGGNFPPDIVIGQVSSIRQFEFELYREADIRSLVDFDTLEFVLIVTSFRPVDISAFEDETGAAP